MFRKRMTKKQSRKNFRKGSHVNKRNKPRMAVRGGIRL